MEDKTRAAPKRWPTYMIGVLFLVWGLLAFLAMFASVFAYGYVPSTNWVEATRLYRVAAGLIAAALSLFLTIKYRPNGIYRPFKRLIGTLAAPFLGYFIGSTPILAGAPMLISMIAGHHVELIYNVAQADGDGGRGCYSPIWLHDLPWFFDRLCVSDALRQELKPNMGIVVEGRGTSLGVYATAIHRVGA